MPALITWWTADCAVLSTNPLSPSPSASPSDAGARTAPDADAVHRAGADLLRRWASPGRRYHTTQHLVEMFWALEDLTAAGEIGEREASVGRVAAWFHDAVYDPTAPAGGNERRSAALARERLPLLGIAPVDVSSIVRLIELTAEHAAVRPTALESAFQDADLWILASEADRFDEYCLQVREEYAQVPEAAYRQGRSAILAPLLERPAVYATAFARREWEAPARANLSRELARLRR